jgi:hypothetical protein
MEWVYRSLLLIVVRSLTVSLRGWEWAEGAAEGGAEAGIAWLAASGDAGSLEDTTPKHLSSSCHLSIYKLPKQMSPSSPYRGVNNETTNFGKGSAVHLLPITSVACFSTLGRGAQVRHIDGGGGVFTTSSGSFSDPDPTLTRYSCKIVCETPFIFLHMKINHYVPYYKRNTGR